MCVCVCGVPFNVLSKQAALCMCVLKCSYACTSGGMYACTGEGMCACTGEGMYACTGEGMYACAGEGMCACTGEGMYDNSDRHVSPYSTPVLVCQIHEDLLLSCAIL